MAFDISTIPDQVLRSTAMGLVTEELSLADQLCFKITDKTTLSGTIPVLTNETTLARVEDSDSIEGLPPGAEAKEVNGGMTTTSYDCRAFVGRALVTDEERNDMEVYGIDQVADRMRIARATANLKIDRKLQGVLTSTSLNVEYDVSSGNDGSGEWNDTANGKPLQDLLKAREEYAPGATHFYYGQRVRRVLLAHPDFTAEFSHFNAGQLDIDKFDAYIASKLGIPPQNVTYIHKIFNSAAEGAAATVSHLFNDVAWLGYKRDLVMVDPKNARLNNLAEIDRIQSRRSHDIQYTRYVDIVRNTQNLGVAFTNLIA